MILRLLVVFLLVGVTLGSSLVGGEQNEIIVEHINSKTEDPPPENDGTAFISWREMVDSIINMTKTIQNSVERSTKELDLTMQAFHASNLLLFEQMKQSREESNQTWKDAFEKQAELFKNQVNRAIQQVSSLQVLDSKDRFTVLHYTESISLSHLYRILRAKQQVESQGHRYELLYYSPVANDQTERNLRIVKDLMPSNFTTNFFTFGDVGENNSAVAIVRYWYVHRRNHHQQDEGQGLHAPPSSEQFWVVSLDLDWLGSLPQALYQLQGRETSKPSFRYPPDFIGFGCVSANISMSENNNAGNANDSRSTSDSDKSPASSARSFGIKGFIRNLIVVARFVSPLRFIRWISMMFAPRPLDHLQVKERDFCYSDLWRISDDLLKSSSDFSTVVGCFNAAQTRGKVLDARAHGLEFGLLSARAFPYPSCTRTIHNTSSCEVANITKAEWVAAKEQYRLLRINAISGIVYTPPGILFRASDRNDFELHV